MPFKHILVPVDFSEFSDYAADYALFLAEKFGARVTVLHTVLLFEEDIDEEGHLKNYEKILQKKEDQRARKISLHHEKGYTLGVTVDSVLLRGISAGNSILSYVSDHEDIDLVVMGTHGRTGITRWLTGSVAEKVVRYSPIPVLTVHKEWPEIKIDKILVPVDFSEFSIIAVEKSKKIAAEFNAGLEFVHVVEREAHPEFYNISFEPILEANPQLKDHIIENLQKLAGLTDAQAGFTVLEGVVSEELRKYAEKNKADFIIMPIRGMGDLEHFFLGSNTEKIVRVAPCPVLTTRR